MIRNRMSNREERGFTLIEIMVATVVLGILTSISIPMYQGVQRHAQEAGVNSDLRSSANATVRIHGDRVVFATPEIFDERSTVTQGNSLVLFMVPDPAYGHYACVWASRSFGENDVYSRYYNSKTGSFSDETCIGEEVEAIIGIGDGEPDPTENEHEEGEVETEEPADPTESPEPEPTQPPGGELPEESEAPQPSPEPEPTPPSGDPVTLDPNLKLKGKFPVCHNASGKKDKYNSLMLPFSALVSHASNHNDIIPPIAGYYAGSRWDAEGIALFNKHCA